MKKGLEENRSVQLIGGYSKFTTDFDGKPIPVHEPVISKNQRNEQNLNFLPVPEPNLE